MQASNAPETEADAAVFHEVGDVLFTLVNVARRLNVDPELALRATTRRFSERVERPPSWQAADGAEWAGPRPRAPRTATTSARKRSFAMSARSSHVHGRQILDSRGNPTVEVDVRLDSGALGRAAVPSGASTGEHEAVELRDGDPAAYLGKGVLKAVANVNGEIAEALRVSTPRISVALDRAAHRPRRNARTRVGSGRTRSSVARSPPQKPRQTRPELPLYRWIGGRRSRTLPVPLLNVINGGAHAQNRLDLQEFMIVPAGASNIHRGAAHGHRGLSSPEGGLARARPCDRRRRRRWVRARSRIDRAGDRGDPRGRRACGARRAGRYRTRPSGERDLPGRSLRAARAKVALSTRKR